ncbi:MAG: imidazole glycerol phosphate synthase subunit HisH [Hyphomicrobiales bacterium]|nr:MAG: imidazole glycerol phosphate synthase subunit HisH [Hyphomicrobiales bacterium]
MSRVTVVNYANSNTNSVLRALNAVGADVHFSDSPDDIAQSAYIVLPGVGHTGTAMASLQANGLIGPLEEAVLQRKVPVLGICLGMHLLLDYVHEGECAGLGWVRGEARALAVEDRRKYKIPHIGWNDVEADGPSVLFPDEQGGDLFYFCHKFTADGVTDVNSLAAFNYERRWIASFEKQNIFGVQFHPEKSHDAGARLFTAFLNAGR